MIFVKSKELKSFIIDLKRLANGKIPYIKNYVFCGPCGTGKTLLANRIQKILPNNIIVIDEPVDERLNITPPYAITIYTQRVPFKRGALNIIIKRESKHCPIVNKKCENLKDIIKQTKKIFK